MTQSDDTALDPTERERLRASVGTYLEGSPVGQGLRVALACARFNGAITTRLLDGALEALAEAGVARHDVTIGWVPGAFELPLFALALCEGPRRVDAVVTLGAVIRGETGHYDLVAGECARGVQEVQLRTRVPVILGVLATDTLEQALARSKPDGTNKGREAAASALEMANLVRATLGP